MLIVEELNVRVFTRGAESKEDCLKKNLKKIYAVTGFTFTGTLGSRKIAKIEVARFKKESYTQSLSYHAEQGVIRKYKNGLDGLYTEGKGTPCIMVWK